MTDFFLALSASDNSPTFGGDGTQKPSWVRVEAWIEQVFELGGTVALQKVLPTIPEGAISIYEFISIESLVGKYRILFSPEAPEGEYSDIIEWWEPDGAPFRGWTVSQHDDPWDDRTYCRDINVAKAIFREYFDTMELSAETLKQFHSGWDRISGGHGNPEPHP